LSDPARVCHRPPGPACSSLTQKGNRMKLAIHGNHLEVTDALRQYVQGKLERVRRHFDQVIDAEVQLSVDKLQQKAEITLRVSGSALHAESSDGDLYAAIDCLMDKLDRQVIKHKDRMKKNYPHASLKHQQPLEAD
jgi:putative sigma-54 modulation protein